MVTDDDAPITVTVTVYRVCVHPAPADNERRGLWMRLGAWLAAGWEVIRRR